MAISLATAMLLSGLIGAGGGLLSNGMQFLSQGWQQKFNAEEAEKARNFSASEADKNRLFEAQQAELTRQWQTDMSNTAYQRSMADMQQAGINPNLLSQGSLGASTGNASTPQGSQAQTSRASSGMGSFSNPFSSLANALNAYATIQNQQLVAMMYNDTNMNRTIMNNSTRKYGVDVSSANFQDSIWKYRENNHSSAFWKKYGAEEL